jgi:predicted amidohydrolase YtcJ
MAQRQGWLGPGSLADLVVLEDDPLSSPAEILRDLRPVGVMVGGLWRLREF